MRSDFAPGGVFPDYELPDHTNTVRRLSELQGDDPLILMLARGRYCPKGTSSICNSPRSIRRSEWPTRDRHDLEGRPPHEPAMRIATFFHALGRKA
jgi:hypothetical protein